MNANICNRLVCNPLRERNRQTAKLNRDRKKEEAKELQDTVQYLKRKNQELQSELNSQPSYLADEQRLLMSFERHFSSQVTSVLNLLRLRAGSDSGAFYVINAASHFFPIIYASPALVELTGYALHEIIGQNCGFLSGLQTSRNEVSLQVHVLSFCFFLYNNYCYRMLAARALKSGAAAGTGHRCHSFELPEGRLDVLEQPTPGQPALPH